MMLGTATPAAAVLSTGALGDGSRHVVVECRDHRSALLVPAELVCRIRHSAIAAAARERHRAECGRCDVGADDDACSD
jgi:hypothetical protein